MSALPELARLGSCILKNASTRSTCPSVKLKSMPFPANAVTVSPLSIPSDCIVSECDLKDAVCKDCLLYLSNVRTFPLEIVDQTTNLLRFGDKINIESDGKVKRYFVLNSHEEQVKSDAASDLSSFPYFS